MDRTALLALGFGVLLLVACGGEVSVDREVGAIPAPPAPEGPLFVQVDGMVKALGIT